MERHRDLHCLFRHLGDRCRTANATEVLLLILVHNVPFNASRKSRTLDEQERSEWVLSVIIMVGGGKA